MWSIKEIKKQGKKILKNNFGTLVVLALFMTFIVGKYTVNSDSFYNLEVVYEYFKDQKIIEIHGMDDIHSGDIMNRYAGYLLSQNFTGNMTTIINQYNKDNGVTKGFIFAAFNVYTKDQSQIQNLINSIRDFKYRSVFNGVTLVSASFLGILIRIFITNPIQIAESRIYLESINYKKTRLKRLKYCYKKGRYWNCVKVIFLKELYKMLWNLTIVGGFIKYYSYKMVTYIMAENPQIKPSDAIKMSIEMMKGNKMHTFKLDVAFLGWNILQYATFGLLGLYVTPYYTATYTALYSNLRNEYIEKKKYNYEMLNDEMLYKENAGEKYEDLTEKNTKKIHIDYDKKYDLTSIIFFFFIFSFAGWLWEVALFLFQDGILVNRGTMYGPWLPIYGVGCTAIILLTRFEKIRELLKRPLLTFITVMLLCTVLEYTTSWALEVMTGLKYWDYTGIFFNINGRVCLECSFFFGLGGSLSVYLVAPLLENIIQKITFKFKLTVCVILLMAFGFDAVYSNIHKHVGEGITVSNMSEKNLLKEMEQQIYTNS